MCCVWRRLIDDGILLERHYSYKICSPSRCSLQSGRLAVHVNTVNTSPLVRNESDPVSGWAGIPVNMTTIGTKMKEGGSVPCFSPLPRPRPAAL